MSNDLLILGLAAVAGFMLFKNAGGGEEQELRAGVATASTGSMLGDLLTGITEVAAPPGGGSLAKFRELDGAQEAILRPDGDIGSAPPPEATIDEDIGFAPDPRVSVSLVGTNQAGYQLTGPSSLGASTPIFVTADPVATGAPVFEEFSTTPGVLARYLAQFE